MKKIFLLPVLFLLLFASDAFAVKRYWIASAAAYWNNTANWSSSSGGAGGSSVPGSSDTAYFDGNGLGNDTLNANISVKYLNVAAGYTGKIVQRTYTITIGTTGAVMSGGTFEGGSGAFTLTGPMTISGCAFTSTSGTLSTNSNFTYSSGSFTDNSGLMKFTATSTLTGSVTLYNLEFAAAATATFTIASGTTLTISNTLTVSGSNSTTINTGAISAQGDVTFSNSSTTSGGTATITINGTGSQNLTGTSTLNQSRMPNIVINKSSGTLYIINKITVTGNWTFTTGTINAGTSTVCFNGTKTISGTHALKNVTFHGTASFSTVHTITIASGTTLTVDSALVASGTNGIVLNTGNIHAKGNITFSNTSNFGGGNAMITINGTTGNQTFTGNSSENDGRTPNITINKTSDTLILASIISCPGSWTYTAGIVNAGNSTVYFIGANTISGSHQLNNVTKYVGQPMTLTSGTTLTVQGTFSVKGNNICQINTGTVECKGNIIVTNAGTTANGDGTILISGTGDQTFTGTTTAGQGKLQNITINKPSGTLYLVNHIFCVGDWTYTAGTINAGTSTVHYRLTGMLLSGTHSLYNVTFYGDATAVTYNISGILTVNGTLTFNGTGTIYMNSGTIYAKGNVTTTNTGTSTGGSTIIVINGRRSQSLTGSGIAGAGKLPHITIDKDSGNLVLSSIISCTGNWVYTGIDTGTVIPGTSTVAFYGNFNVDGQTAGSTTCMSFYNIAINGNTRTLTGNVDCNNNFTIASGTTCSAGSNKIYVGGDWNSAGTWTYGTSTVVFDGNGYNKIQGAAGTINFSRVELSRTTTPGTPSKNLRLLNPVSIKDSLTLNKGRLYSTSSNYLSFIDTAKCAVTNNDSAYVHGPIQKTGNYAFVFPLGDTTLHDSIAYHPLAITAPGSASDRFEAVYRATAQTQGATLVDSLVDLSTVENWSLERQVGTSVVGVTISWNRNSTNANVYGDLRVANWNGTMWGDLGASAITINGGQGLITATSSPTFVSNFAYLALSKGKNNFPFAVLKKKLDGSYYKAINGRLFFKFDEEYYETGDLTFNIYNDEHVLVSTTLWMPTTVRPQVVYGDNRYHLNTVGCDITPSGALGNGFYILEVINDKNEVWYLRFEQDSNIILSNCPPSSETE